MPSVVTQSEGIGSNNNDTTIPTSAAVKAYADSVGGSTITVQDEGSALSTGATTLNFVGCWSYCYWFRCNQDNNSRIWSIYFGID